MSLSIIYLLSIFIYFPFKLEIYRNLRRKSNENRLKFIFRTQFERKEEKKNNKIGKEKLFLRKDRKRF